MSDPLAGTPLPATHIDPDVAKVLESVPKVYWASMRDQVDAMTWEQMKLMSSGIGEPHVER